MRVTLSEFRSSVHTGHSASTLSAAPAKAAIGTAIGLAGGVALAVPIMLWDWASSTHSFWELPMAATSWVFGMSHFEANGFDAWSVLIGILLLAGFAIASGAVFEFVGDRVLRLRSTVGTVATGLGFGFVAWMFTWYTLLPIAHNGAPFHETAIVMSLPVSTLAATVSVAPVWTFVLGFALLGLTTATVYRSLRRR